MTMTIRRAKQLLPYIEAFANGKTVQKLVTVEDDNEKLKNVWENMDYFSEELFDKDCVTSLRIKPSPKYRQFANAEECWQEMLNHQPFGWIKDENGNYFQIVLVADGKIYTRNTNHTYNDANLKFKFADGDTFGAKVEEK